MLVAAVTGILEPYVIAFTDPGYYPYNSATSWVEYILMVLVAIDMGVSFRVARYKQGELVGVLMLPQRQYLSLGFRV